jgi:plasmid maintenance system antidote protein VapI
MEALSHAKLVRLIQAGMGNKHFTVFSLATKAGINEVTFARMIGGDIYFTDNILARLGKALQTDYSLICARYSLWRYQEAMAKIDKPKPIIEPSRGGRELEYLARQIIATNPDAPNEFLTQQLMEAANIFEPMAATAIQNGKIGVNTGDYGNGRENSAY